MREVFHHDDPIDTHIIMVKLSYFISPIFKTLWPGSLSEVYEEIQTLVLTNFVEHLLISPQNINHYIN